MMDHNFDPYAVLEDLANQLQRIAFHQQKMSEAIQGLTVQNIKLQQQIEKLAQMDTLINTKVDLSHADLQAQIKGYIPPHKQPEQ